MAKNDCANFRGKNVNNTVDNEMKKLEKTVRITVLEIQQLPLALG